MQGIDLIFQLLILLFSAIIHEVAHGYAALFQGDPTAKYENRLTLNPLRHIDPIGSVVMPLFLFAVQSPVLFGWAKPVPFNPYNLRNRRWGEAIVALAGPATNLTIGLIFGLVLRFMPALPEAAVSLIALIVIINLMLAVFNLVPVPPLDGSKILFSLLPQNAAKIRTFLESYSIVLVFIFVFFLWNYISPLVLILFSLITGIPLQ